MTIMFTDIEGSTALRTSLGDADTDALFREHDELVRKQIEENKGFDLRASLGDGFLAVFVSTRRAVACAIGIQKALDSFNRGRSGAPLKIRIGLNTGEVAWQEGQLSGEAVHAASRVCNAASGGQIFVSDVTRQLAGTVPDVTFHDSGEYELKGFPHPWRLYEVVWVRETTAVATQVFVGREQELGTLRSKLLSALDGNGSMVLVGGEPGVGKTTLVRQLIHEAEQRGALAVFGRCYESEGTVPYSPFVEMLEQALALMPPEIVREDMADDASEVARLVPELRRRFPDIPEPLDLPPDQQRRYFFNALGSFISRGASRFPLLLVMDDVHWADEPTLLLIEYMAALMPDLRILGVGTYRDVELEVSRPLAASLERMLRARVVDRVLVKRFDRDGVANMVSALSGKAAPDNVVDAIFAETEGNPFFVEEVFRHLVEEGKVFDEQGEFRADLEVDELDVPESVRLVVGRRLERLGATAQKALGAAAVVGRAFRFTLLEEISDLDAGILLDIVEEAEAARVIVPEERDGEIHYFFAHELIRQTLLSGLSLLRRQRLHLAIANAIERTDKEARTERPSEIAHHLLQAGAAAETSRTLEYLELSTDRAISAAAFEEALKSIDDALSIVDEDDAERVSQLLYRQGVVMRALGRLDECMTIWDESLRLAGEVGDLVAVGRIGWEMLYLAMWLGRFDTAFEVCLRAGDLIGETDIPERAAVLVGSAAVLGLGGLEGSLAQLDEAESIARRFEDANMLGRIEWVRSFSQWTMCHPALAYDSGHRAIALLRETNDQWTLADALCWTAYPAALLGRVDEAKALVSEGLEIARRINHLGGELLALRGEFIARMLEAPNLDECEAYARWDLERCDAIGSPWASQAHAWMSMLHSCRGDFDAGLQEADEAVRTEPGSGWSGVAWYFKLMNRTLARDDETCRSMLAEPIPDLTADGSGVGHFMRVTATLAAAAMLDERELSADLYPRLASIAERMSAGLFDAYITHRIVAMGAACAQQWDDAVRHFAEAERLALEQPNRWDEPQVWLWKGKMLLDRGHAEDRSSALELLERARDEFESRGVVPYRKLADEFLQ